MAKEQFTFPETRQLFTTLEQISQRSGVSRGQAFENVIRASVCAAAAETMEPAYFDAIKDHTAGPKGKRGVDLFPVFFAQAVEAMSQDDNDVLGDLFQSAVSYGENGLYLTPQTIASLLASLTVGAKNHAAEDTVVTVHDPCCSSGLLLMEASKANPDVEVCGQDVDARCCDVAALNLGLRGRFGWIVCGNSLTRDVRFVYRIGSFFHESANGTRRGVIRNVPPEQCSVLPEILQATRQELFDQTSGETPSAETTGTTLPRIIEVPRWLAKVEPMLAALDAEQTSSTEERGQATRTDQDGPRPEGPPRKQQELF